MKRKKRNQADQPERRRALAEINLIGQRSSVTAKAVQKRAGCAQIFGLLSLFGALGVWLGLAIALR